MSADDNLGVIRLVSVPRTGQLDGGPGTRRVTAFKAALVSGLTFGSGLAGVAMMRFNAVAWRGSQLLGAAALLAVTAGGAWYWRRMQVWLDVTKDLHS
jgi:hypothetical protein